jgi:16S rRNA (guanine527-N7)-methyltransferase
MGNFNLSLLIEGLTYLKLNYSEKQLKQFATYIKEINFFNATYKLVGSDEKEFIVKHLLDSLTPLKVIESLLGSQNTICDIGSGGGLPAIPLAIMLEDVNFVLVERMGRRVDFLNTVVAMCNLEKRVKIVQKNLNEVKEHYNLVTFRALQPLVNIIRDLEKVVQAGGYICAYKGKVENIEQELAEVARLKHTNWQWQIKQLDVPFLEGERSLCIGQRL